MVPIILDQEKKQSEFLLQNNQKELIKNGFNVLNILGILLTIFVLYWAMKENLFTSETALRDLLSTLGTAAPFGFIFIQIIQTVIPIIPGALTIPMGSMIFGFWYGFLLNFIGIMIGSIINFLLARKFGRPFVEVILGEEKFTQYSKKLENKGRFEKWFIFGMFFPFSPADLLCYFAGLSTLSFRKYLFILNLGKPFTLFIYSFGTIELFRLFFQYLT